MSSGFFNTIRESLKEKWEEPITTFIIVHDSSTSSLSVDKLFEARSFLNKHYTDYCMNLGNHICLLFDLLQGNNYEHAAPVTQKEDNIIEYRGNAITLLPIYDKIMRCKSYKAECSMKREDIIPQFVTSPMARFIDQAGTCIILDKSEYTIQFKKIK